MRYKEVHIGIEAESFGSAMLAGPWAAHERYDPVRVRKPGVIMTVGETYPHRTIKVHLGHQQIESLIETLTMARDARYKKKRKKKETL